MDLEWGPLIEHDGGMGPQVTHKQPIRLLFDMAGAEGKLTCDHVDIIKPDFPGFYWRWKRVRVGWFKYAMRRVCDDPAYAPVAAYRFAKPRSTAVDRLTEIVERPPGAWIKDGTDSDPRLPKKVPA